MPGMDGFEVCHRLKANPATAGIPIIFLTGESDATSEADAREAGAVGYVTKPIDPDILLAKIRACLDQN
jgi:putative two-component system response regulator